MRDTPFHAYYMHLPPGLASGDDSGYFSATAAAAAAATVATPAGDAGTRCDSVMGDDDDDDDLDHDDDADGVVVEMPAVGGGADREEEGGEKQQQQQQQKRGGSVEKGVARLLLEELDALEKEDEEDVKMLVRLLLRRLRLV